MNSLSPIDRTVDRIAKGINGISPQKLKAINDANRGGGSAAAAAAGGGGGVREITAQTQAIGQQTQVITALNKAQEKEGKTLKELTKQRDEEVKKLNAAKIKADALNQTISQMGITQSGLTAKTAELGEQADQIIKSRQKADEVTRIGMKLKTQEILINQKLLDDAEKQGRAVEAHTSKVEAANKAVEEQTKKVAELDDAVGKASFS